MTNDIKINNPNPIPSGGGAAAHIPAELEDTVEDTVEDNIFIDSV